MRIVLAGGTGFLGSALRRSLEAAGHEVAVLTRRPSVVPLGVSVVRWDGKTLSGWAGKLEGADAVINLCGSSIARRWTPPVKEDILRSRVEPTRALVGAIERCLRRPKLLINASAVGYYGEGGEKDLTEESPAGEGFLAEVCRQWEEAAVGAEAFGTRVVRLRLGVVLGPKGGILARMAPPFQLFIGGPLGSGKQWLPWIHLDDVIGVIDRALHDLDLAGPVNVVAPQPVRMDQFCRELGHALRRPSWARVPVFVLRGLMLGEAADVALVSQRVLPRKLEAAGYSFRRGVLRDALEQVFIRRRRKAPPSGVASPSGR